MSYILDALRKSERERQTGQVPGLPNLVAGNPPSLPRWIFWVVGLLLSVNLAGLSYWLFTRPETSQVAPRPVNPAATLPAPVISPAMRADQAPNPPIVSPGLPATPVPAVVIPAQPVPPAPVVAPATAPPAVVMQSPTPAPSPAMPNPAPVTGPEPPMTTVPPGSAPYVVAPPPAAKAQPRPGRRKPPADVAPEASYPSEVQSRQARSVPRWPLPYSRAETMDDAELERETEEDLLADSRSFERTAQPSTIGGRSGRNGIPHLRDLPLDFQERIPPIKISMFAYSRNPSERFVIIDMKKHRAGDQIPGGALLLEIQAENLLLELDGQKFLLPRY